MQIDLFSDTVCPWCRIGKKYLDIALEVWEGEAVEVNFRAYFLNEGISEGGRDFKEYLQKSKGLNSLEPLFDRPRELGRDVGLKFNFEDIDKAPNTMKSHQLYKLYSGLEEELLEGIFNAYFEEGKDIGDVEILAEIGHTITGEDRENILNKLISGEKVEEVNSDYEMAKKIGVRGVPFFVINGEFSISGAQKPEILLNTMQKVVEKKELLNLDVI